MLGWWLQRWKKTWMVQRCFENITGKDIVVVGFDEMRRVAECVARCLGGIW